MARLKLAILAFCCFISLGLNAQTSSAQLDDAKIAMIRAAVIFYSTDTLVSKAEIACDAKTITELKSCAKPLTGVDKKIDVWNSVAVSEASDLKKLGETIVNTVSKDREYRKKLPAYQSFTNEIKRLGEPAVELQNETGNDAVSSVPPSSPPANASIAGNEDQVVSTPVANQGGSPVKVPLWKDPFILSCLALVLSLIALIVALMAKNRKSHRRSGSSREAPPVFSESGAEAYQTQTNISALQRQVANLEREMGTINTMIEDAERRLNEKVRVLESQHTTELPGIAQATSSHAPLSKKWAKNVDGGGFEMDSLSSEPDSKMIYEITQTGPQTATFKVSETRDAQLFALTNPQNYLREGCNYTSQPAANSQIRTEVPGTLELQGRKWRITNPAQITFY